ncbi:hypothetical protein BY458DRAFT_497925 [Sporodiniella umbellata]|nr:hypothetical protein BY458DRAFT_497925 [Sporodiniella umbellata]
MTFSNIITKEHDLTRPRPTLSSEAYPTATLPSATQAGIELKVATGNSNSDSHRMTLSHNEQTVYLYNEQTLYHPSGQIVWGVVKREAQGITLGSKETQWLLSTDEFWFSFREERYQWKLIPFKEGNSYTLNCYSPYSLVAQLNDTSFRIDTARHPKTEHNPFKPVQDSGWLSALVISGLMIHEDLQRLLHDHPQALKTLLNGSYPESDDGQSILSTTHHDAGSLFNRPRPSSFKSIELNPGLWQKLWRSCFPCCMPGGWCDRACLYLKYHPRSRQGWQQHS